MIDAMVLTKQRTLEQCESVVERGLNTFMEVGSALMEIRDNKLYLETHDTFEEYLRERWNLGRAYAHRIIQAAQIVNNMSSALDILPTSVRQVFPLISLSQDQRQEAWERVIETAPGGNITGPHVQSVVDRINNKPFVANNAGNNEWYTPPTYLEAARRVMGEIDLDPASSKIANKTVKAKSYFTADDDGLSYSWIGRVWMNPPYSSDLVGKFADKLVTHFQNKEISEAIVLVNNATETGWFKTLLSAASSVCLPEKRVKFLDVDGNPGAPLQGQAVLYFGTKVELFADAFGVFGKILYGR